MANVKTTQSSATLPSADQFVAEYMARKLNGTSAPKLGLLERTVLFIEDVAVDSVADSKRVFGRVSAAWDAASEGYEEARVLETRRQAERAAKRLGLH